MRCRQNGWQLTLLREFVIFESFLVCSLKREREREKKINLKICCVNIAVLNSQGCTPTLTCPALAVWKS